MRLERVFITVTPEQVRRLLSAVVAELDSGFSLQEVDEYCSLIESDHDPDDLLIEPIVAFEGQETPFVVDVMDKSSGAFEIVIITSPAISKLVQGHIAAKRDGVISRVIPA